MKIPLYFKFVVVFTASFLFLATLTIPKAAVSQTNPTPIPTPENPQAISQLQRLLLDKDCLHPCWLAWTLGVDHLQDAQRIMKTVFRRPIQNITGLDSENGFWLIGYSLSTTYPLLDADGAAVRFPDSKIVLSIQQNEDVVVAGGLTTQQPRWSYVDWSAYGLDQILTNYGIPDEVTISYPIDGTDAGYNLIIRYLELGIFINYGMVFDEVNFSGVDDTSGIPICNHLTKIAVLQAWYQSQALPELDLAREWDDVRFTQGYEYSLAQVSQLDLAQFTELLSEPSTCFTTLPLDEWGRPQGQHPLN